jgi:serine/threonine protein kinase
MHSEDLRILYRETLEGFGYAVYGPHCNQYFRPGCGPTVHSFFFLIVLHAMMADHSFLCSCGSRRLLEELGLIHEHGVIHGDLQPPNVILQNQSDPHFIDFSHAYRHDCTGHATCPELIEARHFLLLDSTDHLV